MTMEFFALGISYQKTSINLREKFAFDDGTANEALARLKDRSLINEAVFLNTCNRAEVYAVTDIGSIVCADVQNALCMNAGIDPVLTESLWYMKNGEGAVKHLFRVASSLDSMVVGEAQILGQIKDAYFKARSSGTTGPFIDRAMLHAIKIAKKIRTETNIGKGQVSVASVAVDLAAKHLKDLSNLTILVIGAGEMGALVVKQLKKRGAGRIVIANRTLEKAAMIAEHTGGETIPWEKLACSLKDADIVVSSTGSKRPVIDEATARTAAQTRKTPLVLIDLGSPRDISPQAGKIENIVLFNIDDLKKISQENSVKRTDEAKRAEALIDEESGRFFSKLVKPDYLATIAMLNCKLESLMVRETEKKAARSIIQKILHDPITKLKDEDTNEIERQVLSDALVKLFRLDEE